MAYITKQEVQVINDNLKAVMQKWGCKYSIKGSNSSSVTVTLREYDSSKNKNTALDFSWLFAEERADYDKGYTGVNRYWFEQHYQNNPSLVQFFKEVFDVMTKDHWDESDSMTDYFHCSYYVDFKIAEYNKPLIVK